MPTWLVNGTTRAVSLVLAAGVALSGCAGTGSSSPQTVPDSSVQTPSQTTAGSHPVPQELATIPQGYSSPAAQQGKLVELTYDTYESLSYEQKSRTLTKRAIVYLPYGYTRDTQYNVFYLMHGGMGNETSTFGTPTSPRSFKNVVDNAIAAGEIKPLIIVAPTYNNTSPQDSSSFSLALTLTQNYHHELINDLMPAVERTYSTYARDVSPTGLAASRDHRGFGGFSMGSVATWRTFQNGLDYFRYFLPMSCGTSLDMDNILPAAKGRARADYFVWMITGTADFAQPYDEARLTQLRQSPYFTEADSEQSGNVAFRLKQGYGHDGRAIDEYSYNGLRWFWNS